VSDDQMNGHKLMEAEDLRKALLNIVAENESRSSPLSAGTEVALAFCKK